MESSLKKDWDLLSEKISKDFDVDADVNGILMLVGIQELGEGFKNAYSKEEKMDLIDLAQCFLLEKMGLYSNNGISDDGWPMYEKIKRIPAFNKGYENKILISALVSYFKENTYIE